MCGSLRQLRVATKNPDTAVPVQNAVIHAWRADGLSVLEALHRLLKKGQCGARRFANTKLRLCTALENDPAEIETLVFVFQFRDGTFCLGLTVLVVFTRKLVGYGES